MNKKKRPETINPKNIEIVGLITSTAFQNAKLCAKTICKYHSKLFNKPKLRGMLEFDWDEHLTKQRRKFGGPYWILLRPVAVYIDDHLIGSDLEFVELVNSRFQCRMSPSKKLYNDAIASDYSRYLVHSQRCYVYLDIWIDKTHLGKLIFQLYSDLLPETCYNFRCLCTGEKGNAPEGFPLSYKNTEIFRICTMGWIQGGDIENIHGGGGQSIYGATFADEGYCISHERRGVLSMANDGKHSNASQFFVTLQPTLWMDYYYVAFGQLVEGVEVLKAIESVSTFYEKPTKHIKIMDCGVLYAPETQEEKEERKRACIEDVKQRVYEAENRRLSMLNECTEIVASHDGEDCDKVLFTTAPANVPDDRDVPSELNVRRFLEGKYYVMDIPINPEDIIRPILNDLANGVIQEDQLIVYTSNEVLARSIINDCIAKGILDYEDYGGLDLISDSDICMVRNFLHAIISNMSTTSSRLREAQNESGNKPEEAIQNYLVDMIENITESSEEFHQKPDADFGEDDLQQLRNEYDVINMDAHESDTAMESTSEQEVLSMWTSLSIDMDGGAVTHSQEVDGIAEMYGKAEVEGGLAEIQDFKATTKAKMAKRAAHAANISNEIGEANAVVEEDTAVGVGENGGVGAPARVTAEVTEEEEPTETEDNVE